VLRILSQAEIPLTSLLMFSSILNNSSWWIEPSGRAGGYQVVVQGCTHSHMNHHWILLDTDYAQQVLPIP
jgi:hypothetical protein